ncbi:MAG: hypothetical protein AUH78_21635 [Gemmatimonadetes bacterium 13_1_40CM_4_69_8]|nr:MAG: hypothetical protein AUH78_21635 [Gemmatimonadetes bacterium 13_1_40CM_4_69_8]
MSDRGVQDLVLRALADAPFRASREWRDRELVDAGRLERFARFLARHFYYERIVHFFKYSRSLAAVTGRRPEAVLRSAGFDALLATAVLGSRETARDVAGTVVSHVQAATPARPIPYLSDLLRYEQAMMIAEAGPRVWRDAGPAENTGKGETGKGRGRSPELVEGTVLLELAYDLPAVLPKLLEGWTEVPQAPERRVKLLVARSPHGRVAVARADAAVASVVELADGRKTLADLARQAGLRAADLEAALAGLADLGAVRFATGS